MEQFDAPSQESPESGQDAENRYYRNVSAVESPEQFTWLESLISQKNGIGDTKSELASSELAQLGFESDGLSIVVRGPGIENSYQNQSWIVYFFDESYVDDHGNADHPFLSVTANRDGSNANVYVAASQSIARHLLNKHSQIGFLRYVSDFY